MDRASRIMFVLVIAWSSSGNPGWSRAQGVPLSLERTERANVLVYLVDTLRAQSLGCYGYDHSVSPHIDAFAAEGTLFEQALAQSSWTRASVASVLTGLTPPTHRVMGRDDALSEEATTLAEILREHGYRTAGFVTNGNAGPSVRFGQGFDVFELLGEKRGEQLHHLSHEVNARVFAWLDEIGDSPFFLYLHTMDPHAPYAPPGAARQRWASDAATPALNHETQAALLEIRDGLPGRFGPEVRELKLGSMTWMHGLAQGKIPITKEMTRALESLYEAEIGHNDQSFGDLVAGLKARGIYERTMIFLVSDHGEEFFEHGNWEHGKQLHAESVRIPLIVRYPGPPRPHRRSAPDLAQHVDLFPTVLEYLGIPPPAWLEGRSLLPGKRPVGEARRGVSFIDLDGHGAAAIVEWPWKLIRRTRPREQVQLFDLARDPFEERDLAGREPEVALRLSTTLTRYEISQGALTPETAEIDDELRERLEAMGYLR